MKNIIIAALAVVTIGLIGTIVYTKKDKLSVNDNQPTDEVKGFGFSSQDIGVSDSDHIQGDKGAALTLVEYSDFQCPYCVKYSGTVNLYSKMTPTCGKIGTQERVKNHEEEIFSKG